MVCGSKWSAPPLLHDVACEDAEARSVASLQPSLAATSCNIFRKCSPGLDRVHSCSAMASAMLAKQVEWVSVMGCRRWPRCASLRRQQAHFTSVSCSTALETPKVCAGDAQNSTSAVYDVQRKGPVDKVGTLRDPQCGTHPGTTTCGATPTHLRPNAQTILWSCCRTAQLAELQSQSLAIASHQTREGAWTCSDVRHEPSLACSDPAMALHQRGVTSTRRPAS